MQTLINEIRGDALEPAREEYLRDFGNIHRATPKLIVRPKTIEDVQAVVHYARRQGLRVVPRGHACSTNGQALSEHILVDMRGLSDIEIGNELEARAGGGCSWGSLQKALEAKGLTYAVYTDDANHTVGGTLSVGGYGTASVRYGGQVDQVTALDVVTGDGELVHARRGGPHQDLFEYTLCGLGQTGFIVRAYLKLIPLKRYTLLSYRLYPEQEPVDRIVRDVASATPRWDHCLLLQPVGLLCRVVILGQDLDEPPVTIPRGAQLVRDFYQWRCDEAVALVQFYKRTLMEQGLVRSEDDIRQLWNNYMLPVDAAPAFARELRARFTDRRFARGSFGTIMEGATAAQLPLAPPPPNHDVIAAFSGPFCAMPPQFFDDYRRRFDEMIDICVELGGRVYLFGYHPRTADFYRRNFGVATFERWRDVKRQYDPGGVVGAPLF
jgi:FAD/FMN-containing dehydrogenase